MIVFLILWTVSYFR